MSWRHGYVIKDLPLSQTEAAVLFALALHANEYSGRCHPCLQTLQNYTKLGRRTVQMAIKGLEAKKLIKVHRGRNRTSSLYTLTLPNVPALPQAHSADDDRAGQAFSDSHSAADSAQGADDDIHSAPPAPKSMDKEEGRETRASSPSNGKIQVPADWCPAPELIAEAERTYPNVDIERETRLFVSKNRSKGTEFQDIVAGWWAWLEHGAGFAERDRRAGTGRRGHKQDPSALDVLRRPRPGMDRPQHNGRAIGGPG